METLGTLNPSRFPSTTANSSFLDLCERLGGEEGFAVGRFGRARDAPVLGGRTEGALTHTSTPQTNGVALRGI